MEEIQLIRCREEAGLSKSWGELIQSIIEFAIPDWPRSCPQDLKYCNRKPPATVADARKLMMMSKHSRSRLPDQIDTIEGIVYVRDLLAFCEGEKVSKRHQMHASAYFVPERQVDPELLEESKKQRSRSRWSSMSMAAWRACDPRRHNRRNTGEIEDEDEATAKTRL